MIDFDIMVCEEVKKVGGYYRRYSDDLIIICPKSKIDSLNNLVNNLIKDLCKLEINPSKTTITYFTRNEHGELEAKTYDNKKTYLQYLGFYFDGKNTLIRSSSVSRYYRKLNSRIKKMDFQRRKSKSNQVKIFKRKLYKLYSHLGKRNFVNYAYRSAQIIESASIRKQLSKHWVKLNRILKKIEQN